MTAVEEAEVELIGEDQGGSTLRRLNDELRPRDKTDFVAESNKD